MADVEVYNRLRVVESQITTHEAVCAERYAGILKANADIKSNMMTLTITLIGMGVALMGGMATILAKIVFH
jgi:hypothetical protein